MTIFCQKRRRQRMACDVIRTLGPVNKPLLHDDLTAAVCVSGTRELIHQ